MLTSLSFLKAALSLPLEGSPGRARGRIGQDHRVVLAGRSVNSMMEGAGTVAVDVEVVGRQAIEPSGWIG
jgi:hypothetical protein